MTGFLHRLGRFSARHHWAVVTVWIILTVAVALGARAAGDKTNDNLTLSGANSQAATDLLREKLPDKAYGSNPVVLEAKSGTLKDKADAVAATVEELLATEH